MIQILIKNHGWHSVSLGKIYHHSARDPCEDPLSWSGAPWYRNNPAQAETLKALEAQLHASWQAARPLITSLRACDSFFAVVPF